MATSRPIPVPDAASSGYWEGANQGILILPRCSDCELLHFPPLLHCPHCGGSAMEQAEVHGTGSVYSFTTLNTPPGPAFVDLVPLTVGVIELDIQPMLLITANVLAEDSTRVRIGVRAQICFAALAANMNIPQIQVEAA